MRWQYSKYRAYKVDSRIELLVSRLMISSNLQEQCSIADEIPVVGQLVWSHIRYLLTISWLMLCQFFCILFVFVLQNLSLPTSRTLRMTVENGGLRWQKKWNQQQPQITGKYCLSTYTTLVGSEFRLAKSCVIEVESMSMVGNKGWMVATRWISWSDIRSCQPFGRGLSLNPKGSVSRAVYSTPEEGKTGEMWRTGWCPNKLTYLLVSWYLERRA